MKRILITVEPNDTGWLATATDHDGTQSELAQWWHGRKGEAVRRVKQDAALKVVGPVEFVLEERP